MSRHSEIFTVRYSMEGEAEALKIVGSCLIANILDEDYGLNEWSGGILVVQNRPGLREELRSSKYDGNGLAVVSAIGFRCQTNRLTFEFETVEDADLFKSYMCDGGGEQHFEDPDGNYYDFEYHDPGGDVVVVKKIKRED